MAETKAEDDTNAANPRGARRVRLIYTERGEWDSKVETLRIKWARGPSAGSDAGHFDDVTWACIIGGSVLEIHVVRCHVSIMPWAHLVRIMLSIT